MIFDDMAKIMEDGLSLRKASRTLGISKNRISDLRAGCPFVVDTGLLLALNQKGYEIKLVKVSDERDS